MTGFKFTRRSIMAVATALALSAGAAADVPRQFNYQGKIAGFDNQTVSLTVTLWDAATGGTQLYTETHTNVALNSGVFAVRIGAAGSGVPTTAVGALPVFVGLSINGGAELTPRTRLTSVPFSMKSLGSEQLVIPGTFDAAATVGPEGHVTVDTRVEIGAGTDGGGVIFLRNASDRTGIQLDGHDLAGGGRIELNNGLATNVLTVLLDGNDTNAGRMDIFDDGGRDAIRMLGESLNSAPELSMFTGTAAASMRETVQLTANFDPDSSGAGELRLRRVDPTSGTAQTTVELRATSDNLQNLPNAGGEFILRHSDGNPVFTVHAGDGGSALSPSWMELRNANDNRRLYASPTSLNFYDFNNNNSIRIVGSTGEATFTGDVTVGVLTITGGADLSEPFDVSPVGGPIAPGMVVSIDPKNPGNLIVCDKAYDRTVAGVISGAGGVKPGVMMSQTGTIASGQHPVALTGRVWVQCDAGGGAIEPGDLLTTSPIAGHAMKAADTHRAPGATLGKAMTALKHGEKGLVLVLVSLQ